MARNFNAAGDEINYGTGIFSDLGPFTAVCWMRTSTGYGSWWNLLNKADSSNYQTYLLYGGPSEQVAVYAAHSSVDLSFQGNTALATDTWYHLAASWDGNTGTDADLYVDGVEETYAVSQQASGTRTSDAAVPFQLGTDDDGAAQFQGDMAEVAIWNVVLTAAEVTTLAAGYSPLFIRPHALVFYAPLWGSATNEPDLISGTVGTVTSLTKSVHPQMIYPAAPHIMTAPASVGGGTNPKGPFGGLVLAGPLGGPTG